MNTDPTPATRGRADYRVLLANTAGLSLLVAASVVLVVAADLVAVAVLGAGLVWLGVAAARRELRIRRRLADTRSIRPEQHARPRPGTAPTATHPGGTR